MHRASTPPSRRTASLAAAALAAALGLAPALGCRGGSRDPAERAAPPAAGGAAADDEPSIGDPRAWRARSFDRAADAQQRSRDGACSIVARSGGRTLWSSTECVGSRGDPAFLSGDGARLVVVEPLPEHTGPDWSGSTVLTLVEQGKVVRRVTARELVAPEQIRDMRLAYSWLAGLDLGHDPASAVRWTADGQSITLRTIDGHGYTFGLDGQGLPPAPSPEQLQQAAQERQGEVQAARDAADARLFRWEDAGGSTHYSRLNEIPREYRARATPVGGAAE